MMRVKFHLAENHKPMGGHRKGATQPSIQRLFRECCQYSDGHRFDCGAVPPDRRGTPYLPVAPMSPTQLIASMRAGSRP